jgi:hypothetical protein
MTNDDVTWEDYITLKKQFPNFCLEDKIVSETEVLSAMQILNRLGAVGREFDLANLREKAEEWSLLLELGCEFNKDSMTHYEIKWEGPTGEDLGDAMEKN